MKLTDICSNERFVKGELFGSRGYNLFINNIMWGIAWFNENGIKAYINRSDARTNISGFTCGDITSTRWKLYEFIDGKMIEYVEEQKLNEECPPAQDISNLEIGEYKVLSTHEISIKSELGSVKASDLRCGEPPKFSTEAEMIIKLTNEVSKHCDEIDKLAQRISKLEEKLK